MYGASLNMLLTLAEDTFSYSERLLMVGHNPGITEFMINALQPQQASGIRSVGTGTFAVIEFPDSFKRHTRTGNLLHFVRQEDLSTD